MAVLAVGNAARGSQDSKNALAAAQILPALAQFLSSEDGMLPIQAAGAFEALAEGEEESKEAVIAAGRPSCLGSGWNA